MGKSGISIDELETDTCGDRIREEIVLLGVFRLVREVPADVDQHVRWNILQVDLVRLRFGVLAGSAEHVLDRWRSHRGEISSHHELQSIGRDQLQIHRFGSFETAVGDRRRCSHGFRRHS